MKKYFAILIKETLQLIRDLPGLMILFLMPALMLIVITLTQQNVISERFTGVNFILVNSDSSMLGDSITKELSKTGYFRIVRNPSVAEAEKAVASGKYQLGLVIPCGATKKLLLLAEAKYKDTLKDHDIDKIFDAANITILSDPAVMKIFKNPLTTSLQMIIKTTAFKIFMKRYNEEIKESISVQLNDFSKKIADVNLDKSMPEFPYKKEIIVKLKSELEKKTKQKVRIKLPENLPDYSGIVRVEEKIAGNNKMKNEPDIMQNNVPAFTLFAMFFIVIPLAGSIINEKQQGTRDRLQTLPVSYLSFLSAKITIYLLICTLQFFTMLLIGRYLLPLLSDLPPFELAYNTKALILTIISCGLAATGFGILVGVVVRNHAQAATFGSVMVVILAILGGIFVPSYMMPDVMRKISIISPLRWGTDAFIAVFARGSGLKMILNYNLYLIGFFAIALIFSLKVINKRK